MRTATGTRPAPFTGAAPPVGAPPRPAGDAASRRATRSAMVAQSATALATGMWAVIALWPSTTDSGRALPWLERGVR